MSLGRAKEWLRFLLASVKLVVRPLPYFLSEADGVVLPFSSLSVWCDAERQL